MPFLDDLAFSHKDAVTLWQIKREDQPDRLHESVKADLGQHRCSDRRPHPGRVATLLRRTRAMAGDPRQSRVGASMTSRDSRSDLAAAVFGGLCIKQE